VGFDIHMLFIAIGTPSVKLLDKPAADCYGHG
jgi:hypothetical protein